VTEDDPLKVKDKMPCFMMVLGDDKQESLINLNQVRLIQKISDSHVRILFDTTFTLELHGESATKFLGFCMAYSVLPDGVTVAEAVLRTQSTEPE
jgi:hypothetical protein